MFDRIKRWLDLTVFIVCLLFAFLTGAHTLNWWLGLGVALVCTPFWIWARLSLGASFSVRPEARGLVTDGLYSKVRHPVYVFGTPAVLGVLVTYLGFGAIVFAVIIAPIEVLRARREEAGLQAAFGEEYSAYKAGTWF